jgi:hypothetical protein
MELPGGLDRRLPVLGLADDVVSLRLQKRPGAGPKLGWSSTIRTVTTTVSSLESLSEYG